MNDVQVTQSPAEGARRSPPSILDILQAVERVAPTAPEVHVWWLGSRSRLPVAARPAETPTVDFVIEGSDASSATRDRLAVSLSRALGGAAVTLRFARAPGDTRGLFRLLTTRGTQG